MARLHEYQGKALLADAGIAVPEGGPATTAEEAGAMARRLARPVVVKMQAWTTARKALGGIGFAATPLEAEAHAARILALRVGKFPVTHVLVEEQLPISKELFVSLSIDDRARCPVILLSLQGGSGIEERAGEVMRFLCDPIVGPDPRELRAALAGSGLSPGEQENLVAALLAVFRVARTHEARSVEINPLVITTDHRLMAADCRITIDDYAVFRHPDLGIEIARELDHPPTPLERIAYRVEQEDHRGTFFFAVMNAQAAPGSAGLIGFHGAGGGGSMMSMDAVTAEGFTIANFCDTSGNPSPAKVYRAARIILAQPGLIGYFGSGSGVANQEQFWSAYGLAKAFWELNLDIPAVIRLGGNTEDRAVEILQTACRGLSAAVEGYRKTDPPARIARRLRELIESQEQPRAWKPRVPRRPAWAVSSQASSFPVKGGRAWISTLAWNTHAAAVIARSNGLLQDQSGKPALTLPPEEYFAKDSDMIACEVECRASGIGGPDGAVFVELDIPGLDDLLKEGR
ncbi:MAG: acetate--CoA ligase family protein [Phycisphaerae bacterium]|nr:acetate--CoA ligase family protein [Phycisphaerae bacterium]